MATLKEPALVLDSIAPGMYPVEENFSVSSGKLKLDPFKWNLEDDWSQFEVQSPPVHISFSSPTDVSHLMLLIGHRKEIVPFSICLTTQYRDEQVSSRVFMVPKVRCAWIGLRVDLIKSVTSFTVNFRENICLMQVLPITTEAASNTSVPVRISQPTSLPGEDGAAQADKAMSDAILMLNNPRTGTSKYYPIYRAIIHSRAPGLEANFKQVGQRDGLPVFFSPDLSRLAIAHPSLPAIILDFLYTANLSKVLSFLQLIDPKKMYPTIFHLPNDYAPPPRTAPLFIPISDKDGSSLSCDVETALLAHNVPSAIAKMFKDRDIPMFEPAQGFGGRCIGHVVIEALSRVALTSQASGVETAPMEESDASVLCLPLPGSMEEMKMLMRNSNLTVGDLTACDQTQLRCMSWALSSPNMFKEISEDDEHVGGCYTPRSFLALLYLLQLTGEVGAKCLVNLTKDLVGMLPPVMFGCSDFLGLVEKCCPLKFFRPQITEAVQTGGLDESALQTCFNILLPYLEQELNKDKKRPKRNTSEPEKAKQQMTGKEAGDWIRLKAAVGLSSLTGLNSAGSSVSVIEEQAMSAFFKRVWQTQFDGQREPSFGWQGIGPNHRDSVGRVVWFDTEHNVGLAQFPGCTSFRFNYNDIIPYNTSSSTPKSEVTDMFALSADDRSLWKTIANECSVRPRVLAKQKFEIPPMLRTYSVPHHPTIVDYSSSHQTLIAWNLKRMNSKEPEDGETEGKRAMDLSQIVKDWQGLFYGTVISEEQDLQAHGFSIDAKIAEGAIGFGLAKDPSDWAGIVARGRSILEDDKKESSSRYKSMRRDVAMSLDLADEEDGDGDDIFKPIKPSEKENEILKCKHWPPKASSFSTFLGIFSTCVFEEETLARPSKIAPRGTGWRAAVDIEVPMTFPDALKDIPTASDVLESIPTLPVVARPPVVIHETVPTHEPGEIMGHVFAPGEFVGALREKLPPPPEQSGEAPPPHVLPGFGVPPPGEGPTEVVELDEPEFSSDSAYARWLQARFDSGEMD